MGTCDTFVVLPPLTSSGSLVFGKNSDRPQGEIQEVVYFPPATFAKGEKLQCTYIEIDQGEKTNGVILSKPSWMWGAEMGANDKGVVIGNEAVYTKVPTTKEEKLLGMDLVRLGLERGETAEGALDIICQLLENKGQGGPCSDIIDLFYHNSFLIADSKEAWVLETAGVHWAAQRITEGFRNISNGLSITTRIDKMSSDLKQYAIDNKLWDGQGEFNFKEVYISGGSCPREEAGKKLLETLTRNKDFGEKEMFRILRDKESDICREIDDAFPTTGSQVSTLYNNKPCVHWFTATPDPSRSVFKPFIFTPNVKISSHTISPVIENDPAKAKPRFSRDVDRSHALWRLNVGASDSSLEQLRLMEESTLNEILAGSFSSDSLLPGEADDLFKDAVETEMKFYK